MANAVAAFTELTTKLEKIKTQAAQMTATKDMVDKQIQSLISKLKAEFNIDVTPENVSSLIQNQEVELKKLTDQTEQFIRSAETLALEIQQANSSIQL